MFKKILGGICCFFAMGGIIGLACGGESSEPVELGMIVIIIFVIAAILLFSSDKRKEKRHKKNEERIARYKEKLKTCTMKHINGLPIAENVNCNIVSTDDKFIFKSGMMNFELDKSKITDMCIRTDEDIQQQYVSSIGGAVSGAVLFGSLGAIIGGKAKKKTIKTEIHNYLIITYLSPEIKYIGFEVENSIASAHAYIDDFKNSHTLESTYQL